MGNRARVVGAVGVALALLLLACEAVGAPDSYRSQVCASARDISGPLVDSVAALQSAASSHDVAGMSTSIDALKTIVDRLTAQLTDVPLWMSGIDVVTDMHTLTATYGAADSQLRQAVTSGDQAQIDAAMAALAAARLAAPGLGDHMRTARLAGLNC